MSVIREKLHNTTEYYLTKFSVYLNRSMMDIEDHDIRWHTTFFRIDLVMEKKGPKK